MRKGVQISLITLGLIGTIVGGIPALVVVLGMLFLLLTKPLSLFWAYGIAALIGTAGLMGLAGFWCWGFSSPQTLSRRGWRWISFGVGAGVLAVLTLGGLEFAVLLYQWLSPYPLVRLNHAWVWVLLNGLGLLGVAVGLAILRDAARHLRPNT